MATTVYELVTCCFGASSRRLYATEAEANDAAAAWLNPHLQAEGYMTRASAKTWGFWQDRLRGRLASRGMQFFPRPPSAFVTPRDVLGGTT